jgi:hypothetical protein
MAKDVIIVRVSGEFYIDVVTGGGEIPPKKFLERGGL